MSVSLDEIPEVARVAWVRLRDELQVILGNDLVALWAHGGTTFPDLPRRSGDLDTYAVDPPMSALATNVGEEERAMEPRDVVQAAIDAYHAHDLDRCLSFYAPDVVVKDADGPGT